ncbi:MAG TPA: MBL fold metallo-hydrolase [Kofleriaceae bacterium]|jgi:glyoxylase-like metal-dependent hydrolase (beta-lactamase superfamily II)|nr:MBL fold metallo-hydrolase [Kofleriaceae bacterium]
MSQSLPINQAAEGVWWSMPDLSTDRPMMGAVAGADATLLVDAGASPAHASGFLQALHGHGLPPVRYVVYTHWHWDHVWGGSELAARYRPTFIASEPTRDKIRAQARLRWDDASLEQRRRQGDETAASFDDMKRELPSRDDLVIVPPTVSFRDQLEIDLGGVTCRVEHVGGDHASDSTIVHVRERKVLFMGDAIYTSFYAVGKHYTRQTIFQLLDRMLAFEAETFLLGHTPFPLGRPHAQALQEVLRRVASFTLDDKLPDQEIVQRVMQAELGFPLWPEFVGELVDAFKQGAPQEARA